MNFKILSLVATALLVAACSDAPKTDTTTTPAASTTAPAGAGAAATTVTPGSQADLQQSAGDTIHFDTDKSALTAEARATLERQAAWLKKYPNVSFQIEGHADERGTREYNLALGDRRATAEKNYLISLGIAASRLSTISYGKERPVALGSDESAWSQNRRAVSVVQ